MWGWIILAMLISALLLPVRVLLNYNVDGFRFRLVYGPFVLWSYPRPKNESKGEKASDNSTGKSITVEDKNYKLTRFLSAARTILKFLSKLRKQLVVRNIEVRIILAGYDPCDLGVHYGETCAAISSLQPAINQVFRIKKQNFYVGCDYVSNETVITAHLDMSVTFLRLLCLVLIHGSDVLKQYSMIKTQRKGGTEHESKSSPNA